MNRAEGMGKKTPTSIHRNCFYIIVKMVVAATTLPPTTKTRLRTRTTTALTTPTSVVGDLCFDACFSQLGNSYPSPLQGVQTKKIVLDQAQNLTPHLTHHHHLRINAQSMTPRSVLRHLLLNGHHSSSPPDALATPKHAA
jgi:hypothetical protein